MTAARSGTSLNPASEPIEPLPRRVLRPPRRCALACNVLPIASSPLYSMSGRHTRATQPGRAFTLLPHLVKQVGIGERTVLGRLQRPDVERHRRAAPRWYDAIDQELGRRHVAVLRCSYQHRLEHGLDALGGRAFVEAFRIGCGGRSRRDRIPEQMISWFMGLPSPPVGPMLPLPEYAPAGHR